MRRSTTSPRGRSLSSDSVGPATDASFSAALGLVALLPRLYVAIAWTREPVWDGHYYDFGARRLAAGLGYSDGTQQWHPWCHWPVGYSGALAVVYKLFSEGPHAATVFNALTGALLAVMTHRLARYELSPWRARAAGLICALYPGLIIYSALVMTEPLAALALVVAVWLWVRDREGHPTRGAALFGACLGLGTLVHPSFIAYAPFLFLFYGDSVVAALVPPLVRRSLASSALAAVCALLPVLPWTLRNCRVMDRCAFVSTNGGWNLAIGSFSRATGRFETLRSSDGCAVVTGQVQQDGCWRDLALRAIRADPARWLRLVPKKLGYTFDHESFPIEYLHQADPDRWPEERRTRGRGVLTIAHRLLLTAAGLGLVPRPGRSARSWVETVLLGASMATLALLAWSGDDSFYLIALGIAVLGWLPVQRLRRGPVWRWALFCVGATAITHAVFFGEDRYHIVVTPMLCILAAGVFRTEATRAQSTSHFGRTGSGGKPGLGWEGKVYVDQGAHHAA
jgi:4-amino-4-deoxy-L-arabinose transferase-like glycosyltransferase